MPADTIDAAVDSLAAAVTAAGTLPEGLRLTLLEQARAAFTDGLSAIAYVSAGLMIGLAAFAAWALRGVRGGAEREKQWS